VLTVFWKWIWALAAAINGAVLLINIGMVWSMTAMVDIAHVEKEDGYAYRLPLNDIEGEILETQFGAWDRRIRQHVRLLEDHIAIGVPAGSIGSIREVGHGASLQWGPAFLFSTSDNSDPRSNGHVYTISFPLVIKRWIVGACAALTLVLGAIWGWRMRRDGWQDLWQTLSGIAQWARTNREASFIAHGGTVCAVLVAAAIVNQVVLDATESLPTLSPDSFSYLGWYQSRTPGYPLFLQAILMFTSDARWIVPVQLNVLLGSSMVMGWAVGRVFQSRLVGLVVCLSLFSATPVLMISWHVLTEILYAACIGFHLAAVATFLRTGSRAAALLIGCTTGAVIAVRPSGYALVACFPLFLLFKQNCWRSVLAHLTAGLAVVVGLIVGAQYARHGLMSTQSFGGFSLAGHVAPLITEDLATAYPEISARVARRLAPLTQQIPDPFSQPAEHTRVYLNFVNPMLYSNIMPEILAAMREAEPSMSGPMQYRRGNDVAMSIALSAIMSRPSWYIMHGLANYWDMWGMLETDIGRLERVLYENRLNTEAFIRDQPEGVRYFDADWYVSDGAHKRYRPIDAPIRVLDQIWASMPYWRPLVVRLVFLSSLLAMLGLFWAKDLSSPAQFVLYTGAALQACIGFLGFVVPGTYRFVVPLMPLLIVFSIGSSVVLSQWVFRRIVDVFRTNLTRSPVQYESSL
jgi:hypothetical protein